MENAPAAPIATADAPAPLPVLDVNAVITRTVQDLLQLPADIRYFARLLDDATEALREMEKTLARYEEIATETALNDPANTNEQKRRLAAKNILAQDPDAQDLQARIVAQHQVVRIQTRKLDFARDRFHAARSLALILKNDP